MTTDHTSAGRREQTRSSKRPPTLVRLKSTFEKMSLSKRIFVSSALVVLMFIGASALILRTVFTISLENVVQEKLTLYTYQLISIGDGKSGEMRLPEELAEPRFNQPNGSLIAFVKELSEGDQQREAWRSMSAENQQFSFPAPNSGQWIFGRAQGDSGAQYYVSSYTTTWSDAAGGARRYVFTIMEDVGHYQQSLSKYRFAIVVGLLAFGAVFLVLQTIILRVGLSPVRRIAADVEAMNTGEADLLNGPYPRELMPLTTNLNRLIDKERHQRAIYRERMADLSHGLKTPLSVLRGIESDVDTDGKPVARQTILETLGKQVSRMTKLVDYQLQRAVSSGAPGVSSAIDIADTVYDIVSALDKVYAANAIVCELKIQEGISFYGDENDLIELIGNLLDNAYKHGEGLVRLTASMSLSKTRKQVLVVEVEDDGKGVPVEQRRAILRRGVRLDSSDNGQGFGLSIVTGIIQSYQAELSIEDSSLGGALFKVVIPIHWAEEV